ncbi:MAG: RluA family pseudouridine synthase [Bacteroidales bacterium]|jgi:23S rRNA pseudouridine1911/1915/1917 synthase|nr:RluA family pseudouridine synthase [Bacteroidales bacterium]
MENFINEEKQDKLLENDTKNFMEEEEEEQEQGDKLYEHFRIVVDKGQGLLRIDKFLQNLIENTSRSKIKQAAQAGNILVNGIPVIQNYKVKPCDDISIVLTYPPREIEIIPEDIPLDIVYEDDDVILINKKAGMVVHPAYGNYTGTLVNALTYYLKDILVHDDRVEAPMLVHRIDKDTSGIMIVAKTELAQAKLASQFFNHTVYRRYYALVWGDFKEDEGTIEGFIGRSVKDRKVMDVFPDESHGKHAVTHWKVIERFGYVTLVECRLETGRTHQIRVHMQHIHHPLFNDATYGGDRILKGTTFTKYKQFIQNCFSLLPRQALHAKSLGFIHPATGKELLFDSNLPEDMQTVLDKWRNYAIHKACEEETEIIYDISNRERKHLENEVSGDEK